MDASRKNIALAEEITDEALVEDYNANRNEEAFLTVYERYRDRITAAVLSQLAGYQAFLQDVDDIAQAVFLDLHKARDRFNPALPHSTVHAFLFNRAQRRTRDYLRRRHAQRRDKRRLHYGDWFEEACRNPRSASEAKRRAATLVTEMLASLPMDEGEALRLTWLEGHTYPSAAEVLGLPLTTVQSRVRTGLQHLRDRFAA